MAHCWRCGTVVHWWRCCDPLVQMLWLICGDDVAHLIVRVVVDHLIGEDVVAHW